MNNKKLILGGYNMHNNGRRRIVVPEARQALTEMKNEIAKELGINNDVSIDKGNLTSRQNGNVGGSLGGNMTRRLVEKAEQQISGTTTHNK